MMTLEKEKEKEKEKSSEINFNHEQIDNSNSILDHIANEITCPITYEPADQLCTLECQHVISLNNLKKLKQMKCPMCQRKIVNVNVRYCIYHKILFIRIYILNFLKLVIFYHQLKQKINIIVIWMNLMMI